MLSEMAYPEGFDPHTLKSIRTFKDRLAYVKEKLGKWMGKGSSRGVFPVDSRKVLKIALNNKGLIQNEREILNYQPNYGILAELFDFDEESNLWIEMEKLSKASDSSLQKHGVSNFSELYYILQSEHERSTGKINPHSWIMIKKYKNFNNEDDIWENEFLSDLLRFLVDYGFLKYYHEYSSRDNWGVNSSGEMKLLDFGYDDETNEVYFGNR